MYTQLANQLKQAAIPVSITELHSFLSGLICGGMMDKSWQPLLYQLTNDGQAYPQTVLDSVGELYQTIYSQLANVEYFDFELLLNEQGSVFTRADSLSEWANHFLLGLGLAQPRLEQQGGDIQDALEDLQKICWLGYDKDDDPEELNEALEEVIEYVCALANFFFVEFNLSQQESKKVLH